MKDNKYSLTGNEFLDFLSWCEIQGIDFEGNQEKEENQLQQDENEQDNNKILIKKLKGRDKYE